MITKSLSSFGLCFLGFYLVSPSSAIAQEAKQVNQYPAEVQNNFMTSCTMSAQQEGVEAQLAQSVCSCYLEEIQKKYTFEQFTAIDNQVANGEPLPPEFNQIVNDCVSRHTNR
jgi:hypothetical protein